MMISTSKTVDEYLDKLPEEKRQILENIRRIVKKTAPEAIEQISYQMPGYKYMGKPLVYFAAFKQHFSLFPSSKAVVLKFENDLKSFRTSAGTIQFTKDNLLSDELIVKFVEARKKEIELSQLKSR